MRVGLIGAGNMARALARGWGDPVLCSDAGSGRAAELAAELGGRATGNREVAEEADLVVLCHKPRQLRAVADEIRGAARAVVSILAATLPGDLVDAYPGVPVFPLIPNTPVEVRQGVICYSPLDDLPGVPPPQPELERDVMALFERLGYVVRVGRDQLDTASAVTAVGPAYQALLVEAQVDAAVRRGLKPGLAARLVTETVAGTAALLAKRGYDTLALRREVTSPGGTTSRGLYALERAGVRAAFHEAIDAATGALG